MMYRVVYDQDGKVVGFGPDDDNYAPAVPPGGRIGLADAVPTIAPPPTTQVTMRQARLALLGAGLLDDVHAAIAAIADPTQRKTAEIEWEYAQTVDRGSSFTQQLAAGLGLTAEQLDALFTQAAAL